MNRDLKSYEKMSNENLYGLLLTEGDQLSREAVDEVVRRGAISLGAVTAMIEDEKLWKSDIPAWWAPLHVVHILGAIGGEEACSPLIKAIKLADQYDNEWIVEVLPPIIGALPPSILTRIKKIVTTKDLDWFTRIHAAEGLAALTLHHKEIEDDVFEFLGDIFLHSNEDEMIDHVACILMDFKRQEFFDALCDRGRNRRGFGVVFTEEDVKKDFAGRSSVERYAEDWLAFYDPQQIALRQARWAEEDAREGHYEGEILDDGMCICPRCGKKKKIGGFLPSEDTPEEGVRCVDCMNAIAAVREGISEEEAAQRRERMLESTRVMNRICTQRYLKESGKDSFDSITEANVALSHAMNVWNALSIEERKRVDTLTAEETERYFENLPVDYKSLIYIQKYGKPGRNDPCFCGSGKKYKKCCIDKVH